MKRKLAALAIAIAALVATTTTPSYALGPLHQYFWDTAGIQHNAGSPLIVDMVYGPNYYPDRVVWEDGVVADASMWYGPKVTLSAGVVYKACWLYISPVVEPMTVYLDVTYGSPAQAIYAEAVVFDNLYHTPGFPWTLHSICRNVYLGAGQNTLVQVRAKVAAVDPGDKWKLYKTTLQGQ